MDALALRVDGQLGDAARQATELVGHHALLGALGVEHCRAHDLGRVADRHLRAVPHIVRTVRQQQPKHHCFQHSKRCHSVIVAVSVCRK